ncbi:hypothetical protein VE02_05967 [Pseudogymnoascus sp. 03VT05]|nr:hypothetical protein VE02_05967 [Pseudogymnoascus sp. 03VT05]
MVKELNPVVWPLDDGYLDDIKSVKLPALVLYLNNDDEQARIAVTSIAQSMRSTVVTGIVSRPYEQSAGHRLAALQHPDDELLHLLEGTFSEQTLVDFARTASASPLVGRFSPDNYDDYYKAGIPLVYICADTDQERKAIAEMVRPLSLEHREALRFATLDTSKFAYHAHGMGLDIDKLPGIVVRDFASVQTFRMDQKTRITPSSVNNFITSFPPPSRLTASTSLAPPRRRQPPPFLPSSWPPARCRHSSPPKSPLRRGPLMASLAELSVPINGTEFANIDALIYALDNWAVKHKFCFRLSRRDKKKAIFVCPEEGCGWRCFASPCDDL